MTGSFIGEASAIASSIPRLADWSASIIGLGLGLLTAFAFSRALTTILVGVNPPDPLTYTMSSAAAASRLAMSKKSMVCPSESTAFVAKLSQMERQRIPALGLFFQTVGYLIRKADRLRYSEPGTELEDHLRRGSY